MNQRPRARLIYNPTSGREMMRHALPDVLDILERGGLEVSCHRSSSGEDAVNAARDAVLQGFKYVIAAGGDGTVNEVINGLAAETEQKRPIVGILPAGTTNDLARALGLPRDLGQAAEVIARRQTRPLDIGKMVSPEQEVTYFVNIAGCGKMTEITFEVPSRQKSVLGGLAYYFKGLEKLPQLKPIHIHLESAEYNFSGDAMLCLIANSNSVGGFEKLAPKASLEDGLLDVLLVKAVKLPEFIRLATLALRGEHLVSSQIVYFQTSSVSITSEEPVEINLDGEHGGHLPRTFSVMKQHFQVMA